MMKVLILFALVLLLAGCDADDKKIKKLEAENTILKDEIVKHRDLIDKQKREDYRFYASNKATIESFEKDAAIYQACNYLFPVCPQSMTEKGKEAIKYGYGGGVETFWYLLILKFAAFGAFLGLAIVFLNLGFLKLIEPSGLKVAKAKELIDTAQDQVKALKKEAEKIKEAISTLKFSQDVANINLNEIFETIAHQENELKKLDTKIKQKQERLKTLESAKSAFDGIR
jgi:hypothetical protein